MPEEAPLSADSTAATTPGGTVWPEKRFRPNRSLRAANSLVTALAGWGLVPNTYVMTTRGRKSGELRSTPVTVVDRDGHKWLVAPYGPVPWVLNVRSAGRLSLRRRGRVGMYTAREVSFAEAGPVLKQYLKIAGATRPYFVATTGSPVAEFIAEANKHPVFALALVGGTA